MPMLVHLAPERLRTRIERAGLRGSVRSFQVGGAQVHLEEALFAMPLLPDLAATYQWTRELRRGRPGRMIAVHFRAPSDEEVLVGPFLGPHARAPLSRAVADLRRDPLGREIVLSRRIAPREIHAVRDIRQDVGWTATPHPRPGDPCVCIVCLPPGVPDRHRRIRAAYALAISRARCARTDDDFVAAIGQTSVPLERAADRLSPRPLLGWLRHHSPRVRRAALWALGYFRTREVADALSSFLDDPRSERDHAVEALVRCVGALEATRIVMRDGDSDLELRLMQYAAMLAPTTERAVLVLLASSASSSVRATVETALHDLDDRA